MRPAGAPQEPQEDAPRVPTSPAEIQHLRLERNAIRELMRGSITLAEAVQRAGGRLTLDASPNPDYFRAADVESLTKQSQVVVLARRLGDPRVQLSDDERSIVTRYDIEIDTVVRAPETTEPLKRLTVEVPGGELAMKEGVAAVVNGPTLKSGEKYLLFLQSKNEPSKNDPSSTAAAGSPNDIFLVTGFHYEGILPVDKASTIRTSPALPSPSAPAQQYGGRTVVSLVAEVRATR
jgi:hypothetical protein